MSLQKPCPTCRQPLPLSAAFCRRCGSPATVERARPTGGGGRWAAVVFGGAVVTAGLVRYHGSRVSTPAGWTVSSEQSQPAVAATRAVPEGLRDWPATTARPESPQVFHLGSPTGRYGPSVALPPGYPRRDAEHHRR